MRVSDLVIAAAWSAYVEHNADTYERLLRDGISPGIAAEGVR